MPDAETATPAPRPAGLLRRLAAMVYDSLLLIAVSLAYGALVTGLNVLIQGAPDKPEAIEWGNWKPLVFLGWMAVCVTFFVYFWGRSGQTLGMRAWRLTLKNETGGTASLKQRLVRAMAASLSMATAGLGYLWCWVDRDAHTWHGRLSRTRVIYTPKAKEPLINQPTS